MDAPLDKVLCRGFVYECEVGFHDCELRIPQRIRIDVVAWVTRIPASAREQPAAVRFDYYAANKDIKQLLGERRFNLIETLGEAVAERLLERHQAEAVEVTVSKFPLHMPNAESVGYVCYRSRKAGTDGEKAA